MTSVPCGMEVEYSTHGQTCIEGYLCDRCREITRLDSRLTVALKMLNQAECPDGNCDNAGTVAFPHGDEEIAQDCWWCSKRASLINNEEDIYD